MIYFLIALGKSPCVFTGRKLLWLVYLRGSCIIYSASYTPCIWLCWALMCYVHGMLLDEFVFIVYPYPSGLLHWHGRNCMIAPVLMRKSRKLWVKLADNKPQQGTKMGIFLVMYCNEFLLHVCIHCCCASFPHDKWIAPSPGCPMWDTQTSRWQSWRKLIHSTLEIAFNIYELVVNSILCGVVCTDKNSKAYCSCVGGLLIRVIVFLMRLRIKEPWYLARSCPTIWIIPCYQPQHIGN